MQFVKDEYFFWATKTILLVATTFLKILKLTFNKQIGLYCWVCFASLPLDSKIMFQNLTYGVDSGRTPQIGH